MANPIEHYQTIQDAIRHLRYAFFIPPLALAAVASAFPESEQYFSLWLAPLWFLPVLAFGFRVFALNHCPWCKLGFLSRSPMLHNGIRLLSAKNCATCGMPGKIDTPEHHSK